MNDQFDLGWMSQMIYIIYITKQTSNICIYLQRHKLGSNLTPVTLESFNQWKKDRIAKKDAVEAAERKQKENRMKAGRNQGMSGKDLFDFNPDLRIDEDDEEDAIDLSQYERKEEGEDNLDKGLSDLSLKVYS